MPFFKTARFVAVPADVAFDVAADVSSYKSFLPLVQRSTVRGAKTSIENGERFDAELAIAFEKLGLHEAFVSRVETDRKARAVKATSSDHPFKSLAATWTIQEKPAGCEVAIEIDYAFRSMILQIAASSLMDLAVQKVMSAFETRALAIYRAAASSI